MGSEAKELGRKGEQLAAEFLCGKGYRLIAQNLTLKQGEIDLLLEDPEGTVIIAEVKTQKSAAYSDPIMKIGPAKQRKLRLLGQIITGRYPGRNVRIDAVTLYWEHHSPHPVITHLESII